jgi:hypothetical protein
MYLISLMSVALILGIVKQVVLVPPEASASGANQKAPGHTPSALPVSWFGWG